MARPPLLDWNSDADRFAVRVWLVGLLAAVGVVATLAAETPAQRVQGECPPYCGVALR